MKRPYERKGLPPAGAAGRRGAAPPTSAIAPVRYFRGAATLRPYHAQCRQCLQLYDQARAEGLYGWAPRGGAGPRPGQVRDSEQSPAGLPEG